MPSLLPDSASYALAAGWLKDCVLPDVYGRGFTILAQVFRYLTDRAREAKEAELRI